MGGTDPLTATRNKIDKYSKKPLDEFKKDVGYMSNEFNREAGNLGTGASGILAETKKAADLFGGMFESDIFSRPGDALSDPFKSIGVSRNKTEDEINAENAVKDKQAADFSKGESDKAATAEQKKKDVAALSAGSRRGIAANILTSGAGVKMGKSSAKSLLGY